MKKPILFMKLAMLSVGLYSCSNEKPNENNEILENKVLTEVSYGNHKMQVYDIYLPAHRSPTTKTMILVHGGGWNAGDKAEMDGVKDFIREQLPHIAVVNINYRLADADHPPYPMQVEDISAVVDHLAKNRNQYHIGTKIAFTGVSAGGHLALLWSYAFDSKQQVGMVCSIVGPTNLIDAAYVNTHNQEIRDLMAQFGGDTAVLKEASPLYQVTATSPPTILFYGAQDPLIPITQGASLHAKLGELNVPHEYTLYPNGRHGWIGPDLLDTSVKLKAFIETHF